MKYKVLQFHIPFGMDKDNFVKSMNDNEVLVDDLCSVDKYGIVVNLWIKESLFENRTLKEKVGSFWGKQR